MPRHATGATGYRSAVQLLQPKPVQPNPDTRCAVQNKILLTEDQIPTQWYNIIPDLPSPPPPPLHPGTMQPVGPDDLAPLFPMALIMQEVTQDSYVDIPGGVLDVYRLWRPSPLFRAHRLEKALDTPARIYYKYEGRQPGRLAQAEHRGAAGVLQPPGGHHQADHRDRRRPVGHGAGVRTAQYGIECEVWQVAASYDQKPYRRMMMEVYGATVHSSPSDVTEYGRSLLAEDPGSSRQPRHRHLRGGRGGRRRPEDPLRPRQRAQPRAAAPDDHRRGGAAAAGDGGRDARPARRLHRWRIELRRPGVPVPAREAGREDEPDDPLRRAGGLPEPDQGRVRYDFGDTAGMTPLMKMHTLGHDFIPPRSTPAACATTACRRWSRTSTSWAWSRPRRSRRRECFAGSVEVRPHRGHRAGARADARHRRRDPRGASAARRPARRRSSSPRCAATATSTWPPTRTTSPARWSTTTSPTRSWPTRCRPSP